MIAFAFSVLLALSSCSTPPASSGSEVARERSRPEIQGHRGARGNYPENTLPAFEFALKANVDVLELDLGVTKDRQVIVSHDPILNPDICTGPGGRSLKERPVQISKTPWSELRKYDCGRLKNARFPNQIPRLGTRMPLLSEVFDLVKKSSHPGAAHVRFNIELKVEPEHPEWTVKRDVFAKAVLGEIKRAGMEGRVVLQSFDRETLLILRQLAPSQPLSYLTENPLEDRIKRAKESGAGILSPDLELLTPAEVQRAHQSGLKVIVWTVNDSAGWTKALAYGVDGIITDYPADLRAWLDGQPSELR